MIFRNLCLYSLSCSITLVKSLNLPIHPSPTLLALNPPPASDVNTYLASLASQNSTPANDASSLVKGGWYTGPPNAPVCDIDHLGAPTRYACEEAALKMKRLGPADSRFMWADRDSYDGYHMQIPQRWSSLDGTCVIDLFHKDGVIGDKATVTEINQAVWVVQEYCQRSRFRPPQGGYIRNIGDNKGLAIAMSRYYPRSQCFPHRLPAVRVRGRTLLNSIPTSAERQTFGRLGTEAQVRVPLVFSSAVNENPYRYILKIDVSRDRVVTISWFHIWQECMALLAICASHGLTGFAILEGDLTIEFKMMHPTLGGNATLLGLNATDTVVEVK